MSSTIYYVVEEFNGKVGRKARYEPVSVHRTLRGASQDLLRRKKYTDVRIQTVLRADL